MTFEFELVPDAPSGAFTAEDLNEMRSWWDRYPTAAANDGTLLVFTDETTRALDLARVQRRPGRNDYLIPQVNFRADEVQLSIVGDKVTDSWFYDFAVWVQERWPAQLQYFGEPVPASDILAASGDDGNGFS